MIKEKYTYIQANPGFSVTEPRYDGGRIVDLDDGYPVIAWAIDPDGYTFPVTIYKVCDREDKELVIKLPDGRYTFPYDQGFEEKQDVINRWNELEDMRKRAK